MAIWWARCLLTPRSSAISTRRRVRKEPATRWDSSTRPVLLLLVRFFQTLVQPLDTSQDGRVEALETPAYRNQLLNTLMRES